MTWTSEHDGLGSCFARAAVALLAGQKRASFSVKRIKADLQFFSLESDPWVRENPLRRPSVNLSHLPNVYRP
jgi:hypothetical protein